MLEGQLGRRERQIMDALFRLEKGSVAEVRASLPDPPSYSAVRTMLGVLEDKGFVRHEVDGLRYLYSPAQSTKKASTAALKHLVATFFRGSPEQAFTALLDLPDVKLSAEQRRKLAALIRHSEVRDRGRS